MKRILDRYIFREIAMTWLGVTMILMMILLTNQFARVLGDVAKGKLPKDAAFDVIGLSAAQYLTVPIGLFLAVMLALGRLYRDSEMPAMMACRVGPSGIYRPLLWLLVPLAFGVAWLSVEGTPRALTTIERISAEARREADLTSIEPGRFTVFGPDRAVVYGERITPDGFIARTVVLPSSIETATLHGSSTPTSGRASSTRFAWSMRERRTMSRVRWITGACARCSSS